MKRKNLNPQINAIKNKIKELSKLKFRYFIHGKYIPGFGTIQLIEDLDTLVSAFGFVKKQFLTETVEDSLVNELGINKQILEDTEEEQTFMGYTLEEWTDEFKVRSGDIQNQINISKLENSLEVLGNYRTEKEKFDDDTQGFKSLFKELNIDLD